MRPLKCPACIPPVILIWLVSLSGRWSGAQRFPRDVSDGDVLIGLRSDGPHSNGYSLIRKIVEHEGLNWDAPAPFANDTLGSALLTPTRLYVKPALSLLQLPGLHALAHITGGGLTENLPRILPDDLGATVDLDAWELPASLAWLVRSAALDPAEALKTFNCGIGMIAVVAPSDAGRAITCPRRCRRNRNHSR